MYLLLLAALSADLQVNDRPMTKQGLGGLRTAAGQGITSFIVSLY